MQELKFEQVEEVSGGIGKIIKAVVQVVRNRRVQAVAGGCTELVGSTPGEDGEQ